MYRYVVDELSKLAINLPFKQKNSNTTSKTNNLTNNSLINDYDWFKQNNHLDINNNKTQLNHKQQQRISDDSVSLTSSFESYYEDLNNEFRFDNLNKFYSPNTKFKQRSFKMLTSYDKDEFMYTYLDNDSDTELVQSLKSNSLKAVRVFQKSYYHEPIRGELIRVPSWRMKEKVI